MYKIIEFNEEEITHFKGKIIQVLNSTKRNIWTKSTYLGTPVYSSMWVLTCLVEEK